MQRPEIFASLLFVITAFHGLSQSQEKTALKPNIANAKVQEVSIGNGLQPTIDSIVLKEQGPEWIGYSIAILPSEKTLCCSGERGGAAGVCCNGCKLESNGNGTFYGSNSACGPLEPSRTAFVFFRTDEKRIKKVRIFSPDCSLDFGGLPLLWLGPANALQSIDLLTNLILNDENLQERRGNGIAESALMAIAAHDSPAADSALEKLIQPSQPERLREKATFWLGEERGKSGLALLRKYAKDSDERFREKIVFAFSRSAESEKDAINDIVSMARNDPSPGVRGQALFWLAQLGGKKEAAQITDSIENDPESQVKKKAVFALSQLKDGEGVPLLISVVKTNKNPVVRKEAVFWLGQSKDPRALDFLEEILTK
ncbi:MAG TPA: HEAT repeat domain-containing protein [Candidatus Angelobacter sp.]|nr:HEAT repeat domain-containing protein [Candidatus Angelobacter sp.]